MREASQSKINHKYNLSTPKFPTIRRLKSLEVKIKKSSDISQAKAKIIDISLDDKNVSKKVSEKLQKSSIYITDSNMEKLNHQNEGIFENLLDSKMNISEKTEFLTRCDIDKNKEGINF